MAGAEARFSFGRRSWPVGRVIPRGVYCHGWRGVGLGNACSQELLFLSIGCSVRTWVIEAWMSTRRCDLAPPPSRCARHRRGYFERRVVAGSCIYNGQGCASAAAACCDWEGPLPARAREAAPSRASGDDPGRGCPRAAPCKARGHNYPLPLSGQVFPFSLLAHSRSLSPAGPRLSERRRRGRLLLMPTVCSFCFFLFLPLRTW